jgi:hypothetical protein
MVDITVPIGSLVSGATRVIDILGDFEPELERIEVNYEHGDARLFFGVTVPDQFFDRARSTVTLERPLNCTLEAIQNKNLLESYDIAQLSDTEYEFPAGELDSSEEYRLVIAGRASTDVLDELITRDCFTGKRTRNAYERNLVYNPGAVTWDGSTVETVISEYRDAVEFDENYLPRSVREAIPETISEYQSTAWRTPHDPESEITDTSANVEDLPEEVRDLIELPADERDWWFSAEVMGDFVQMEGPMKYHDLQTDDGELPVPQSFEVHARTEFPEGQGLMEGTITFRKTSFWEELEEELLQI